MQPIETKTTDERDVDVADRDDIPSIQTERFLPLLLEQEEEGQTITPCFTNAGINYMYIRYNNLYRELGASSACKRRTDRSAFTAVLALSKKNTNAIEILSFLHKLAEASRATSLTGLRSDSLCGVQVLTEYFKELEEESIRDNFVIVYELLDEMMDFGFPQTTESKILQEYITQESHKLEVQARPPMAVTNAVSWRSEGIRYRKNEVFLDVVESVNLLVSVMHAERRRSH